MPTFDVCVCVYNWQGLGQYISVPCSTSSTDYACTPCSQSCPVGSYISVRCNGRGRSDTSCSVCRYIMLLLMTLAALTSEYMCRGQKCRSACKAGLKGVQPGEYIAGQCTGRTFRDVQTCLPCKTCPSGFWGSQVLTVASFVFFNWLLLM